MHLFNSKAAERLFFSSALPGQERARLAGSVHGQLAVKAISGFDLVFLESVEALE